MTFADRVKIRFAEELSRFKPADPDEQIAPQIDAAPNAEAAPEEEPIDWLKSYEEHHALKGRLIKLHKPLDGGGCTCGKADCDRSIGKHPKSGAWQKLTESEAVDLATENVGLRMGNGIVGLDVDGQEGRHSLAALEGEHGPLPETLVNLTGSGDGLQFLFHTSEDFANAVKFRPGLDVRSKGGQVVVCPSLHKSTRLYAWKNWGTAIAELPERWVALLREHAAKERAPHDPNAGFDDAAPWRALTPEEIDRISKHVIDTCAQSIEGDNGSAAMFHAACECIRQIFGVLGWTNHPPKIGVAEEISKDWLRAIKAYNLTAEPPWSDHGSASDTLGHKFEDALPRVHADACAEDLFPRATYAELRVRIIDPALPENILDPGARGRAITCIKDRDFMIEVARLQDLEVARLKEDVKIAGARVGDFEAALKDARKEARLREAKERGLSVVLPMTREGRVRCPVPLFAKILEKEYKLARNTRDLTIALDGKPLADDDAVNALGLEICSRYRLEDFPPKFYELVSVEAAKHAFDPVVDYINRLPPWDGIERLVRVPAELLSAPAEEIYGTYFKRWAIGAVRRALEPGCMMKNVLALQGVQDALKSTFFRVLAGPWFSDTGFEIGNKDTYLQIHRAWIYEWSELSSVRRCESEKVKAFLGSPSDNFRAPYARLAKDCPRRGVIVGTTNRDDFLVDPTGDVRFWVVPVGETIDIERARKERDQLWAEAAILVKTGEPHWLSLEEDRLRKEANARFRDVDPVYEQVRDAIESSSLKDKEHCYVVWSQLCARVGLSANCAGRDRDSVRRALRDAGFAPGGRSRRKQIAEQEVSVWIALLSPSKA